MVMSADKICFGYNQTPVLNDVGFSLDKGDCLAILGTNGTGKSTLLKCINRILNPSTGLITINGIDSSKLSRRELAQNISYVAQSSDALHATVLDTVLLGRKPYIKWDITDEDMEIAQGAISHMGLDDFTNRYVDELSGGERQKVMIARAIAQQPTVMLLDEPTSALDMKNQMETIHAIQHIVKSHGITVIATMHDLNLALRFANKFMLLKDGAVFAIGGSEVITEKNISEVYSLDVSVGRLNGMPFVIPA